MRKIEYTLSSDGILPHSPQFGGIQGENGVTTLVFTPDTEITAAIEGLKEKYDSIIYRVDCLDGAGHLLVSEAFDLTQTPIEFTLTDAHTAMGGRLCVTLVISGVNNDTADSAELYSFPAMLYFKEFPARKDYSERHDLNQAVVQVKKMREEVYDMAASALETHEKIVEVSAEFDTLSADMLGQIKTARDEAVAASQSASESRESAAGSADSAAGYAGSALTASVQASGYASDAQESRTAAATSASAAEQSAADAAASLESLLAVTGDINAVLATVVEG